ncbi:MAG TPA: M13 family metallopeptidase N-terminal domain-containing protein, partial [Bacteroidia bacterium]|nr:M13 family metallopeptidase N-terminal domain-containing protein [Bacteroidia bacterium]
MRPFPLFISAAFLTAAFPACTESISTGDAQRPDLFAGKVDSTVKPSDDFFQFVNGMWFHDNPVPASEKSWGIGHVVQQEIYARLRKINDDASKAGAAEGTGTQKIGDFWLAGMDSSKADQMGIQPLEKELKMISDCKTRDDVVAAMIRLEPLQIGIFYAGFYVTQDPKHSEEMTVMLWQGGLGLPDREYYSGKDSANIKIRDAYVAHISKMLSLSGTPAADAEIFAQKVFDFESSLAANCRRVEDLRHSFANYHKMATEDVTAKLTSLINWNDVCNSFGIKADSIVVGQPEFFKALNKSIRKTPVEVLRAYMQFHLVSAYATYLSKEIDTEHFNFEGR